ncbi:hypothetical protein HID58_060653 [Brassica napus]|uniref:Uncharacterized protein n=1 Tax=Brassica napus TaxID=3708 RepID=A0ABQ7ZWZ6_BRANA|nr:hypothetical protein HID58_060653 [Brassica napus]
MLPSLSINSLIRKQQNNLWDDLKLSHCRERSHLRLLSLLLRLHLHLKSSHGQVASRWTFELNLQLLAIVSKPLLQVYNSKWRPKKKKIEDKSSSTF